MFRAGSSLASLAVLIGVSGCAMSQLGPQRPITIDDDVTMVKTLARPDVEVFDGYTPAQQAIKRNEFVTARMYIADAQYHVYEAQLTRDLQTEGMAASLANLGLTTSAALIPVAQTKSLLSGIAGGLTGADSALSEKVLLSNTIQALQTQMRADRKEQAGVIYARMLKADAPTPIWEYTLPMAMADVEAYYQAGTVASALIGLQKTVSAKETSSDQAKASVGPNARQVASVKAIASPSRVTTSEELTIVREKASSAPQQAGDKVGNPGSRTPGSEKASYAKLFVGYKPQKFPKPLAENTLRAICMSDAEMAAPGDVADALIRIAEQALRQTPDGRLDVGDTTKILQPNGPIVPCAADGGNFFERTAYTDAQKLQTLIKRLNETAGGTPLPLESTLKDARGKIKEARAKKATASDLKLPPSMAGQMTRDLDLKLDFPK